ncbi:MAG: twin-arginine translocation signal domain-containing protein, partial [Chloroflexi bacterium]|nr:twin-arginine translocation signal domain-containing protein [Chloroflexota bacterium]
MNEIMRGISRRRFLRGVGGSLAAVGLAACEFVTYPPTPTVPVVRATPVPVPTPQSLVREVAPTELKFSIGSIARRNADEFDELLEVFHNQNPNIRVILDVTEEGVSHRTRFLADFAAGLDPDIVHLAGPPHYHGAQLFRNLNPYAKYDASFEIEAYYARIVDYY